MKKINYCALTTLSTSLKHFVIPSALYLSAHGYVVTVGCCKDNDFSQNLPKNIAFLPLDIERGYSLKKTIKTIGFLYRYFRKNKTDMVEYGTENVAFCAAIAAGLAGVPVRIYNHWGARYIGYSGISRQVSLFIERTAAIFSTDIRQQSIKNMDMCIKDHVYPAGKVSVIGYGGTVGADFSKFDIMRKEEYRREIREQFNIPSNAMVFGDVGSIRKDKGTNELLQAFKGLNMSNTWLMLVGEVFQADAPQRDLIEWAQKCSRVVFTGSVNDVERYISAFDCIVHPSYREGLGMVLQEAGALGVPYITTNIPGPSEFGIDGETGFLVEKEDYKDLQNKMQLLSDSPELLSDMSRKVYELTTERYEQNTMVKRIYEDRENLRKKLHR